MWYWTDKFTTLGVELFCYKKVKRFKMIKYLKEIVFVSFAALKLGNNIIHYQTNKEKFRNLNYIQYIILKFLEFVLKQVMKLGKLFIEI